MRKLIKSTIALTIASSLTNLAVADDSGIEKIID